MPTKRPARRGNDICPAEGEPIEERHLVEAVRFAAYAVEKYGEVYLPIFERIERELAEFRRRENVLARARKVLRS